MSVLINLSIFPTDKGASVSAWVARSVAIIRDSGLPYTLGPMGTSIEGEWESAMAVVDKCFTELRKDSSRIYMTIQMDYRQDAENRLEGKIRSVEDKIAAP
jgi:uncharacterized protein (TIGR00106 family)